MTYLIVASILLIVGSAGALAFGWITANESLVWMSITATVGAAVLLALAYYRSIRALRSPIEAGIVPERAPEEPDAEPESEPEPAPGTEEGAEAPSTQEFAGPPRDGATGETTPDDDPEDDPGPSDTPQDDEEPDRS